MRHVVTAKLLLFDADRNVLLLQRSETHPHAALEYDLPGGEVDASDLSAEAAIVREVLEETGLVILPKDLSLVYAETLVENNESRVRLAFIARYNEKKPDVTISWEHRAFEWVTVDEAFAKFTSDEFLHPLIHLRDTHLFPSK